MSPPTPFALGAACDTRCIRHDRAACSRLGVRHDNQHTCFSHLAWMRGGDDNLRRSPKTLRSSEIPRSTTKRAFKGGKGHAEEVAHFLEVIGGRDRPEFSVDELVATTLATFAAVESMRTRAPIEL